jgi:plastocyanin
MRRLLAISLAIPALFVLQAGPVEASGGGGCGGPITEDAGTAVSIADFCFEPTVLYASPGEEITWTNRDPTRHDVLGSNAAWGSFEALRGGATTSTSFDEPGVYPYVCTWHIGMTGAVVVGDGGFERLDIAPVARVRAGGLQPGKNSSEVGMVALLAAVALTALFVLGMARAQRRERRSKES